MVFFFEKVNPTKYSGVPYFRTPEFRYRDFAQFESILIEHALEIFKSADNYFEVASSIFKNAQSQNIRYIETSFHAGMIEFLKISGQEILEAITSAAPADLEVRVFLGISRNAYTDYLGPVIENAVENWDNLAGIDLHGPEDLPMEEWTSPLWDRASSRGLEIKAHAGEFGPASNIDHAIQELGVKRIQHGVAARESNELMKLIIDRDICLDMCPISNYKLRVIDSWTDHPLGSFLDKGIKCTISTDDPFSFSNTLEDEFHACVEKLNLHPSVLPVIAKNGFLVADLPETEKELFIKDIDLIWAEFLNAAASD